MKFSCLPFRTLTVLAASGLVLMAHAQVAAPDTQAHEALLKERAQVREQLKQEIAQQREQIEARKLEAEKACWQRFAVEGCLRDVRAQAREQDNVLRSRELDINNEARQEKAAERLRQIEQKKNEKQASAPVTSSLRSKDVPEKPTTKSPADIAQAEAERAQAAQERAAEKNARVAEQQATLAEHALTESERRAKVKKNMQDKQQAAEARRAAKADDIANRKGAPLPIPEDLLKP